uniref:Uncharacterized protein n=1 Tax=Anguilla anguilla TaxID=7936 RepID=A0A0E9W3C1_ANGAN
MAVRDRMKDGGGIQECRGELAIESTLHWLKKGVEEMKVSLILQEKLK